MSLRYDWPPKRGTSVGLAIGTPASRESELLRLSIYHTILLSFFVYHHKAFDLLPSSFLLSFEYTFSCHLPSFIQFFISESVCQPHLRKRNTGLEALTKEASLVKAIA